MKVVSGSDGFSAAGSASGGKTESSTVEPVRAAGPDNTLLNMVSHMCRCPHTFGQVYIYLIL